ncbi:zona pellucida-like domain-containing protein 1 [Alosa pseudoharengus]|uniref:zona pellucida-like domain-containing protein 1 n=1 Tax=Alosa pseudoharengus TaxID=34774 RepID=UPI003F88B6C7
MDVRRSPFPFPAPLSVRTMWLSLLVYQLALLVLHGEAQNICSSKATFREPENSDISVVCGTKRMELQILLCPMYYGGYNESLMALNAKYNNPSCYGTPDLNADPPVLKFNFSITEQAVSQCSNRLTITQERGSGVFSDYSNIQFVNISGIVNSLDPGAGTITYRKEMMYLFSCRYPLQYLVNNTELSVSGVSLVIKDNNGSFISTLSMRLFRDAEYSSQLQVPDGGLSLKTRIFVEVKATNLTERFNVLLDRCYATTSPYPINSTYYDLFVGCTRDGQTVIRQNGDTQKARFSFEAFRFVEHKNKTVSTFYLHCETRLCEKTYCSSLQQNCSSNSRRKREVMSAQGTSVSDTATVTSGPIITKLNTDEVAVGHVSEDSDPSHQESPVLGVAVAAAVIAVMSMATLGAVFYWVRLTKKTKDDLLPLRANIGG